jgi:hypothetical protein
MYRGHMPQGRGFSAPFGERRRKGRQAGQLKSRGLVVDLGPQQRARQAARAAEQLSRVVVEHGMYGYPEQYVDSIDLEPLGVPADR